MELNPNLQPFLVTLWDDFQVVVIPRLQGDNIKFEINYDEAQLQLTGRTEQDVNIHVTELLQSNEG